MDYLPLSPHSPWSAKPTCANIYYRSSQSSILVNFYQSDNINWEGSVYWGNSAFFAGVWKSSWPVVDTLENQPHQVEAQKHHCENRLIINDKWQKSADVKTIMKVPGSLLTPLCCYSERSQEGHNFLQVKKWTGVKISCKSQQKRNKQQTCDDDEVNEKLTNKSWHVLQRLLPRHQQRIHPW